MKKLRFIIAACTIVAGVGGALAFKSVKVNGNLYCSDFAGSQSGNCGKIAPRYSVSGETTTISKYCVSNPAVDNVPCPETKTNNLEIDQ
jgi:hypothetical protein